MKAEKTILILDLNISDSIFELLVLTVFRKKLLK